jgi:ABC-type oligopeptide transport system ATPase subunit
VTDVLAALEGVARHFVVREGLLGPGRVIRAVQGVSVSIALGETLGLVGESGSGKSTLGRLLAGLDRPTTGRVLFEGRDLASFSGSEMRLLRRSIQYIFQDPLTSLDPRQRSGALVGEALAVQRLARGSELEHRVAATFRRVGLDAALANRFPHELSGGQRQRVGIARAIVLEPTFLVCDEPLSALDLSAQAQVLDLLSDLAAERASSRLFISHDLRVVRRVADRVAVLLDGRIVETGPTEEVFSDPKHPYTRLLLQSAPGGALRGRRLLASENPTLASY